MKVGGREWKTGVGIEDFSEYNTSHKIDFRNIKSLHFKKWDSI